MADASGYVLAPETSPEVGYSGGTAAAIEQLEVALSSSASTGSGVRG